MKLNKVLLILIFTFGLWLRLFQLTEIPAILNRDEAALAYNALLISQTGKDEWQNYLPLAFKSFGDYKLPGYIYLLTGLYKFLPANDFVVKLPSVLAGSALIILAYYFAKNILKLRDKSSLVMALLIAVNPIFFFYSRIAFEANVALLFFVGSIYLLFQEKRKILFSAFLMLLAILTYNTPLLLLPFIVLVFIYQTGFLKVKQWLLPSLLLGVIFIWALVNFYSLASQKSGITILSDPGIWEKFALYRQNLPELERYFFGNRYVFYLTIIWQNLLKSFSLNFLVENGGSHPWHSLPGRGHIYYLTYFFAIFTLIDFLGEIVIGFHNKKFNKKNLILLYLLIVALAPSLVTVDSPHATRSLFFFFMMVSFASIFFDKLSTVFAKNSKIILVLITIVLAIESIFYYFKYFVDYPRQQPPSLFVEYKNLITESTKKFPEQKIAVIDKGGYHYILTAWYLKLPSNKYFATIKYQDADNINFFYGEQLVNYHFVKELTDKRGDEKIVISQELGLIEYE